MRAISRYMIRFAAGQLRGFTARQKRRACHRCKEKWKGAQSHKFHTGRAWQGFVNQPDCQRIRRRGSRRRKFEGIFSKPHIRDSEPRRYQSDMCGVSKRFYFAARKKARLASGIFSKLHETNKSESAEGVSPPAASSPFQSGSSRINPVGGKEKTKICLTKYVSLKQHLRFGGAVCFSSRWCSPGLRFYRWRERLVRHRTAAMASAIRRRVLELSPV